MRNSSGALYLRKKSKIPISYTDAEVMFLVKKYKKYGMDERLARKYFNFKKLCHKRKGGFFTNPVQYIHKLNETKGMCHLCGNDVGINNLTADHILPISEAKKLNINRKYTLEDIQFICVPCHRRKDNND